MTKKCPKCGRVHWQYRLQRLDGLKIEFLETGCDFGPCEIVAKDHVTFAKLAGMWMEEAICRGEQIKALEAKVAKLEQRSRKRRASSE